MTSARCVRESLRNAGYRWAGKRPGGWHLFEPKTGDLVVNGECRVVVVRVFDGLVAADDYHRIRVLLKRWL